MFSHIHGVWKHRNQIERGVTLTEQIEKKRQLFASEITAHHESRDNGESPNDCPMHIFHPTVQEHLHKNTSHTALDNWLGTHQDLIKSNAVSKKTMTQQQNSEHDKNSSAFRELNSSSGACAATTWHSAVAPRLE